MKPSIRTYLCNDDHRFFGEGPCQLLHAIDETGSLRSAALSNMAYAKALPDYPLPPKPQRISAAVTTGGKGGRAARDDGGQGSF